MNPGALVSGAPLYRGRRKGRKDRRRTPMAMRYQACLRQVLTDARIAAGRAAGAKWTKRLVVS